MVGPSALNGLFGIRPTHGISDLRGVLPVSEYDIAFSMRSVEFSSDMA